MKLKIAICDDEAKQREYVLGLVNTWANLGRHLLEIKEFPDAESFLFHYDAEKDLFQDYHLLAMPLGNNVASAATWDTEKAERLLEEVGFGERYADMPKKLETPLYKNFDEDGVNISGGEAQKIALARALYKDAPFIILDERQRHWTRLQKQKSMQDLMRLYKLAPMRNCCRMRTASIMSSGMHRHNIITRKNKKII